PSWSSISTIRISTVIPTRLRYSSDASARNSELRSFRPCAAWDTCSLHLTHVDGDAGQLSCAASFPLRHRLGCDHSSDHWSCVVVIIPAGGGGGGGTPPLRFPLSSGGGGLF